MSNEHEFENRRLEVIKTIWTAFADVEREDGITLHEARIIDDYGDAEQRAEARKLDKDQSWTKIPDSDIERHPSSLSFFDAKGFRYYIPAYMTWVLNNLGSDSFSKDSTIYSLSLHNDIGLKDHQLNKFSLLNRMQCFAICQFLLFMSTLGDGHCDSEIAKRNLTEHWAQFGKDI